MIITNSIVQHYTKFSIEIVEAKKLLVKNNEVLIVEFLLEELKLVPIQSCIFERMKGLKRGKEHDDENAQEPLLFKFYCQIGGIGLTMFVLITCEGALRNCE